MIFGDFLEKDITVHTTHGHAYRGVLKKIHINEDILEFQVGIDVFYILADSVYAVTDHGLQRTNRSSVEDLDYVEES